MSDNPAYAIWGEPALRVTLMPRDTNAWGTIFGGVILSYIDLAGGVEARKNGGHTFVTVAMREVVFHHPVYVGDLVSFYTRTERVGRTSVTVKVMVEAERFHQGGKRVKVTEAEAVYVAVDEKRRPIAVGSAPASGARAADLRSRAPGRSRPPARSEAPAAARKNPNRSGRKPDRRPGVLRGR